MGLRCHFEASCCRLHLQKMDIENDVKRNNFSWNATIVLMRPLFECDLLELPVLLFYFTIVTFVFNLYMTNDPFYFMYFYILLNPISIIPPPGWSFLGCLRVRPFWIWNVRFLTHVYTQLQLECNRTHIQALKMMVSVSVSAYSLSWKKENWKERLSEVLRRIATRAVSINFCTAAIQVRHKNIFINIWSATF